ncbi:MAG: hypothetical protein JST82_13745 [Bacteroidetes bacterium]|nr:hypothetical protein [Bacteroidota bacterium]
MKLPSLTNKSSNTQQRNYGITVNVAAQNEQEAAEMQEAIQSFVQHFSLKEMKSAAHKLKTPTNRAMIKTFL